MGLAGRLDAVARVLCECALFSPLPWPMGHGGDLAAVQRPGRQDAAEAGSAGRGVPDGTSGEVNAGLVGRLDAGLGVLFGCNLRSQLTWR